MLPTDVKIISYLSSGNWTPAAVNDIMYWCEKSMLLQECLISSFIIFVLWFKVHPLLFKMAKAIYVYIKKDLYLST